MMHLKHAAAGDVSALYTLRALKGAVLPSVSSVYLSDFNTLLQSEPVNFPAGGNKVQEDKIKQMSGASLRHS